MARLVAICLTTCSCFLVLFFATARLAWADTGNLFEVAVPVASQSSTERAKAASLGLREVLIRMSGFPSAVDTDAVRQAYPAAQEYLEQYQYEPYPTEDRKKEHRDASELLVMTFSQRMVEQLLREADQPYWPSNRPPVFVWLVEDSPTEGKMLVNKRDAAIFSGLLEGARDRGLQLKLPLLDLEDQLALSAEKLWQLDRDAIFAASERYDVDTILVGRYSKTSRGTWLSTWQFFHRGASREYDYKADSGEELGAKALNPLADHLANLYAISPQENAMPQLAMQLSGINHFGQYRQALDYLEGLALVSGVQLQAARGDTLLLHLKTDGGLDMLRNALALDRKLQPSGEAAADDEQLPPWLNTQEGTPEHPVKYVWQGKL